MNESAQIYESLMADVCIMDRKALIKRLLKFQDGIELDFSREYLEACETERIRHILAAALWRSQMKRITAAL